MTSSPPGWTPPGHRSAWPRWHRRGCPQAPDALAGTRASDEADHRAQQRPPAGGPRLPGPRHLAGLLQHRH
jgi:hypothetical protein